MRWPRIKNRSMTPIPATPPWPPHVRVYTGTAHFRFNLKPRRVTRRYFAARLLRGLADLIRRLATRIDDR